MGRVWGGNWMNGIHPCRDLDWWKAFRNHQCCVKKSREGVWGDFPGSPVVRTLCFPYRGTGSIPSQGTKILHTIQFSSVQSLSRVWLWPHGLQPARPPCPSPTPGVCSNSWPMSQWRHPTISSSVILFSSCLQSFPASGSFPGSQFFTSDGQSIRVSASASVLPMNIQDWFPLGWTSWISLQSKGLSRVFSNTTVQKCQFFSAQLSL